MNAFCPLIKDNCKGNECVMWKDEKCVFISFFSNLEMARDTPENHEVEEMVLPEDLISATPEELATVLIQFIKKEYSDEERIWRHNVILEFLLTKDINIRMLPMEIQLKLEKAERLADKQLTDEKQVKMNEQLDQQKIELPSLVSQCVDWAKEQGLSRITKSDVEAFLMEKNIELLPDIHRKLYSLANVKIKSKKY